MHVSPLARPLVVAAVASLFVALALSFCSPASGQQISGSVESGRISGAVVDRENGRPVASAQVIIVGLPGGSESDLDGLLSTYAPVRTAMRSSTCSCSRDCRAERVDSLATDSQLVRSLRMVKVLTTIRAALACHRPPST